LPALRAPPACRARARIASARLAGTPFVRQWDQALALHAQRLADPFASVPAAPQARS
jgi:hypothetical protein